MLMSESNSMVCNANRDIVYKIICESHNWPEIFEPCLSVNVLNRTEDSEHIEISALVNQEKMTWESHRFFLKDIYGINSKIIKPMNLVKFMETSWRIISLNNAQCLLVLEHNYIIEEDVSNQVPGVITHSDAVEFIKKAIITNSKKELFNIKCAAERTANTEKNELHRTLSHSILCNAPASNVYNVISDVMNWPKIFDACVSATILEKNDNFELVKIDVVDKNRKMSWNTQRTYFPNIYKIHFDLPIPMPFLKNMNGEWRVIPLSADRCLLNVVRNFSFLEKIEEIHDDIKTHDEAVIFINNFVNENAENEMWSIKHFTENNNSMNFSRFEEKYFLPYSPNDVYHILHNVWQWPSILPHCDSIQMIYDDSENQEFVMTIKTSHGVELFRSIRKCNLNNLSISYFQPSPPAILKRHSGSWTINPVSGGSEILSIHTVEIDPSCCENVFNNDDLLMNKRRVKELISNNSQSTIEACGRWLQKAECYNG